MTLQLARISPAVPVKTPIWPIFAIALANLLFQRNGNLAFCSTWIAVVGSVRRVWSDVNKPLLARISV